MDWIGRICPLTSCSKSPITDTSQWAGKCFATSCGICMSVVFVSCCVHFITHLCLVSALLLHLSRCFLLSYSIQFHQFDLTEANPVFSVPWLVDLQLQTVCLGWQCCLMKIQLIVALFWQQHPPSLQGLLHLLYSAPPATLLESF